LLVLYRKVRVSNRRRNLRVAIRPARSFIQQKAQPFGRCFRRREHLDALLREPFRCRRITYFVGIAA